MGLQAARGNERAVLRIMALLVSLAVLAERAAVRSWPVRFLVLSVLRRAEVVATRFVFEATGAPLAGMPTPAIPNDPADAIRLAARFHALAAVLGALLALISRYNNPSARPGRASGRISQSPGGLSLALNGWTPRSIDTS